MVYSYNVPTEIPKLTFKQNIILTIVLGRFLVNCLVVIYWIYVNVYYIKATNLDICNITENWKMALG